MEPFQAMVFKYRKFTSSDVGKTTLVTQGSDSSSAVKMPTGQRISDSGRMWTHRTEPLAENLIEVVLDAGIALFADVGPY